MKRRSFVAGVGGVFAASPALARSEKEEQPHIKLRADLPPGPVWPFQSVDGKYGLVHPELCPVSHYLTVIDEETGEPIEDVAWADDEHDMVAVWKEETGASCADVTVYWNRKIRFKPSDDMPNFQNRF